MKTGAEILLYSVDTHFWRVVEVRLVWHENTPMHLVENSNVSAEDDCFPPFENQWAYYKKDEHGWRLTGRTEGSKESVLSDHQGWLQSREEAYKRLHKCLKEAEEKLVRKLDNVREKLAEREWLLAVVED